MPVLFGNTYILPAIIVVVLLLVLILVLALRARAAAGRSVKTAAPKSERPATAPPRPTPVAKAPEPVASAPAPEAPAPAAAIPAEGPAAAAAPSAIQTTSAVAPTPAPPETVSPAAKAPISTPDSPRRDTLPLPGSDPLQAVIIDILHGWGDVTEEDTNRLSLFKPDKVFAAVKSMEVPKELKSNKYARGRLGQLRQFAEKTAEEHKSAAVAPAVTAAVAPTDVPAPPETDLGVPEAEVPTSPAPSALEAETQAPAALWAPEEPPSTDAPPIDAAATETAAAEMAPEALTSLDDVDAPADIDAGRLGAPIDEDLEIVEEAPLETIEEIPLEFEEELQFEAATPPAVDIPRAGETVIEPPSPEAATQPAPAVSFLDEPEDSVSGLIGSVKTADDLFALPPQEQNEMVAFLQPEELSKVFQRTNDPELKRAIIDTLEHVSNPASLEVLRRCLDDPDPRIQLYALEAADRLLGVD